MQAARRDPAVSRIQRQRIPLEGLSNGIALLNPDVYDQLRFWQVPESASTITDAGSGFAPTSKLSAIARINSSNKTGTATARTAEEENDIATSMM